MQHGTKQVIFLAEDDDDHYFIASKALEESRLPCDFERASNGKELLRLLEETEEGRALPSMILLDLNMPKMDGRSALEAIAAHPRWSQIPVVVLTTSPCEEDESLCCEKGVKRYLQKPASFQSLVQILGSFREIL